MGLLILTESNNVVEGWQFSLQVIRARRTMRIIWPDEFCLPQVKNFTSESLKCQLSFYSNEGSKYNFRND